MGRLKPPTSGRGRRHVVRALLVAIVATVVTGAPISTQAQLSAFQVTVGPAVSGSPPGPPNVVGDQNRPGLLQLSNTSFGAGADNVPLFLSNLRVNLSCNQQTFPCPAGQFEGPVFCLDGQAGGAACPTPGPAPVGRMGTSCAGTTFAITGDTRSGQVTFVPSAPIVLGPSNGAGPQPPNCIIDFTVDVVGRPADGNSFAVAGVDFTNDPNPGAPTTLASGFSTQFVVNQAAGPTITTDADPNGTFPPPVTTSDSALLAENVPEANPTGTVTFRLIGPNPDGTCSTPIVAGSEQARPLVGGTAASTNVSPTVNAPGLYNWVARYDGDVNFAATGFAGCGDPNEQFTVALPNPSIDVQKEANPTSRPEPGGTFTFTVRIVNTGPTAVTIESITDNVYGDLGDPANPNVTNNTCDDLVLAPTTLQPGANTACSFDVSFTGAPRSQTDIVTVDGVDEFGTDVPDVMDDATITITPVQPAIDVLKTANPVARPEPGGAFTFTVQITNTSPPGDPVTIQTITDNVYGNLADPANPNVTNNTCDDLVAAPTTLQPGGSTTCSFDVSFTGAPRSQTDIVTVTGVDDENTPVQDSDDAMISITPNPPSIDIVKTANPTSRPEPGGAYTFTLSITNTSGPSDPVTIQTITDNIYGNLGDPANPNVTNNTCPPLIGRVLPPAPAAGSTVTCSFTGTFTGAAGASQTDTITVTGVDDENTPVTDTAQATVTITPSPPSITVDKTADPLSRPAPGGSFTFTVVITNTSSPSDPVTIQTITDNIYGNLGDPANPNVTNNTCPPLIGRVLAPAPAAGSSVTCAFTANFTGAAGASQTDIVTVTGVDDEGTPVSDADDATVFLTGGAAIEVQKDASPLTRPEPGGDFTYTFVVRNPSGVPVTITSLNDNVYGNLATRPGSTCGALIGVTLAPGATSNPCSFTAPFTGNANASLTDVVTVTGTDPVGTTVTDTDDATVRLTDVPPQIAVTKAANPLTRPAPGGAYTFTVQVRNPSTVEPLIITGLTDNIYGDLATRPGSTCGPLIGATLAPGASSPTCTFTVDFTGAAGATQTDIVTATGRDDENNTVTATAQATIGITNVNPQIVVTKTASPQSRPEPGGAFTFTVQVFNNGPVSVRITSITDNIYGNLGSAANGNVTNNTCPSLINRSLATGASAQCSFTANFTGQPGMAQTDVVTVTGVDPAGTTVTDDDDATVFITGQPSSIRLRKDATPASRPQPGGVFTFAVTVTNTSAQDSITILTLTDNIYGNLGDPANPNVTNNTCPPLIGRVLAPGQSATCSFGGVFTGRGGQSQTDTVTVTAIDDDNQPLTTNDDATVFITSVPPLIDVQKDANPTSRPEPGGSFTFTVRVTNLGINRVVITRIVDNIYGDLNGRGTCAIGATLQPFPGPGNVYICSFSADFRGNAGASQTDVITVTAIDDNQVTTTDSDDATVTLTNLPPTITSTKTANPTTRPEPGGTFTFTFSVTNTSVEPVRITSLVDNIYGDLNGRGTCAVGATLQPGQTYTCSFTASFTGVGGQRQTDIITVTAVDDENTPVTSTSTATIELTNVPPTIDVTKTASPASRVVPGGDFTFTMRVVNTSNEPVTVTSIVDNVFGNLNGRGTCAVGAVLQPGQSYTCSFTASITSNVPGSHTDTITVRAVDNQGNPATDDATATVRIEAAPAVVSQQQQPLPRTGLELRGPVSLAGLMVAFGFILVGATWRAQRPRLAFTPAPDGFTPPPPPASASAGFGLGLGFGGGAASASASASEHHPLRAVTGSAALSLRALGAALFRRP